MDQKSDKDAPKKHIVTRWGLLWAGIFVLLVLALVKVGFAPEKAEQTLIQYLGDVSSLFIAEMGVALIVAFIVAYAVERQAHQHQLSLREQEIRDREARERADAAEAERRRMAIANDVIEGVYGLRHKPAYVKAVLDTNLQSDIVRDLVDLDYCLADLSGEQLRVLGVKDGDQRFVMLRMVSTYEFQNISTASKAFDVRCSVAVRHGPGARKLTGVESITIDGKALTIEEISNALFPGTDDEKTYAWPKNIEGGGRCRVEMTAVSIKERSDNEVWGSFFPTVEGVAARFSVLKGMRFGVRPLIASNLHQQRDEAALGTWKSDGPILPNNSMVFWWRTPEDDGEQIPAAPVAEPFT